MEQFAVLGVISAVGAVAAAVKVARPDSVDSKPRATRLLKKSEDTLSVPDPPKVKAVSSASTSTPKYTSTPTLTLTPTSPVKPTKTTSDRTAIKPPNENEQKRKDKNEQERTDEKGNPIRAVIDDTNEKDDASDKDDEITKTLKWSDFDTDKQSVIQQLGAKDVNERYYFQSVLRPDSDEFQFEFLDRNPNIVPHDHNVTDDWTAKATSADVNTVLSPNGTVLIVPRSGKNKDLNTYLADAKIDNNEKEAFLQRVINTARTLSKKSNNPIYVTTDGTGVDWLHVRVEEFPKHLKENGKFKKPEKSPEYEDKICSGLFFGRNPPKFQDGKCLIPVVHHDENTIIYSGNQISVNYIGNYSHYYFNELGFAYSTENDQNERMWESITFPGSYFSSTEPKRESAMYDFINGVAAKKYYIASEYIDESSIYAFKLKKTTDDGYHVIERTGPLVPKALYMPTEKYFSGVPQGIRNVGVSCYINAALQMYRNYRIITGPDASPEIEKNNDLKVFLDNFVSKRDSVLSPTADDLKKLFDYKSGEMGDSADIISKFDMNIMNISADDLLKNLQLTSRTIEDLARKYFQRNYDEVAKSDHIALSVAHHIMSTEDKYKTLASDPPHTYEIGTNNYMHLNNIQREIPREIKLGDRTFGLTSVVFHRGNNLNSGHYIAACKWFDEWYLHDDHDVRDYNDQFNNMKQFSDGPPYAVLLLYVVKKGVITPETAALKRVKEALEELHKGPDIYADKTHDFLEKIDALEKTEYTLFLRGNETSDYSQVQLANDKTYRRSLDFFSAVLGQRIIDDKYHYRFDSIEIDGNKISIYMTKGGKRTMRQTGMNQYENQSTHFSSIQGILEREKRKASENHEPLPYPLRNPGGYDK